MGYYREQPRRTEISGPAVEVAEVVAVLGVVAAQVDREIAVDGEVVAVAVGVGGGLADPPAVLLVGEGLASLDRALELALRAAPAELPLAGFASRGDRGRGAPYL